MLKRNYVISILIILVILINTNFNVGKNNYSISNINSDVYRTIDNLKDSITTISNKDDSKVIAKLDIPKINISKNIYDINDKNNNVNRNVQLLKGSILPGNDRSIIFLAAHSGNSRISFFDKLDNLNNGDIVILEYNNYKYSYIIYDKYLENKDGNIEISSNNSYELILTTCSKNHRDKQLIICSKLLHKEKIS